MFTDLEGAGRGRYNIRRARGKCRNIHTETLASWATLLGILKPKPWPDYPADNWEFGFTAASRRERGFSTTARASQTQALELRYEGGETAAVSIYLIHATGFSFRALRNI